MVNKLGRSNLDELVDEALAIIRDAVAEADNPVMLYSIGKDSTVMLDLALRAFAPMKPPFPLLHVDTTWKFREMIAFRDETVRRLGLRLLVHTNQAGLDEGVTPFTHGSARYTDIMKTEALKQALDAGKYDIVFGGARRDEEKSRAKERIFSFRDRQHRWDPRNQRPEIWNIRNTMRNPGESVRVFPLSNWTEMDVWNYIARERLPVVDLYFAKERPVVERNGQLLMVDDKRFPLEAGEIPLMRSVRFRTLGCYPLTAAVLSTASTMEELLVEMGGEKVSERAGRLIDFDQSGSMERKKHEGYF
ncbi:MAG TPA: sulfate adenylyltransferase subunit CysD [Spirochaetota bacterium]|nr:sulfate adenylyltransferase subunit CysD [Spirochaetota bacterium]